MHLPPVFVEMSSGSFLVAFAGLSNSDHKYFTTLFIIIIIIIIHQYKSLKYLWIRRCFVNVDESLKPFLHIRQLRR